MSRTHDMGPVLTSWTRGENWCGKCPACHRSVPGDRTGAAPAADSLPEKPRTRLQRRGGRKGRMRSRGASQGVRTRREAARAGVTLGQLRGADRHVLSRQEITAPRLLSSNLIFPISEYTL